MLRTCWAKLDSGVIWNFTNDMYTWEQLGCFLASISGLGYENKLTVEVVGNDFITTERTPQQINITGTLLFDSEDHIKQFDNLFHQQVFKLYYDASGLIDPQDQISSAWYKEVEVTKFEVAEQKLNGFFEVAVTFTPVSSKAKRDVFTSTTVDGIVGNNLQYPTYYPYFYSSGQQLISEIRNEGNSVGVVIRIKNTGDTDLEKCNFYVDSTDGTRQYASWLYSSIKLEPNKTLTIDSRARTQEATVTTEAGESSNVVSFQHPNPQYVNFVNILNGDNSFYFDFGRTNDIEVTIEIQEESGVL